MENPRDPVPTEDTKIESIKNDKEFLNKIKDDLVQPAYFNDIENSIIWRTRWRKIGNVVETLGKIIVGLAAIFSFATGYYDYKLLSFVSGSLLVIAEVFFGFSSYSMKESKERTEQANRVLGKLELDEIVDIVVDSAPEQPKVRVSKTYHFPEEEKDQDGYSV